MEDKIPSLVNFEASTGDIQEAKLLPASCKMFVAEYSPPCDGEVNISSSQDSDLVPTACTHSAATECVFVASSGTIVRCMEVDGALERKSVCDLAGNREANFSPPIQQSKDSALHQH